MQPHVNYPLISKKCKKYLWRLLGTNKSLILKIAQVITTFNAAFHDLYYPIILFILEPKADIEGLFWTIILKYSVMEMIILIFKIIGIMLLDEACNIIFEISISWWLQTKSLLTSKKQAKLFCYDDFDSYFGIVIWGWKK